MLALLSSFVAAVVKLIRIFSPLVIAPLFQLPASLQLLLEPPPPVQVPEVTDGGALYVLMLLDHQDLLLRPAEKEQ